MMNVIIVSDTPSSGKYLLEGEDVSHMNDDQLQMSATENRVCAFQTSNLLFAAFGHSACNVESAPHFDGNIPSQPPQKNGGRSHRKSGLSDRIRHKTERVFRQRQRVLAWPGEVG